MGQFWWVREVAFFLSKLGGYRWVFNQFYDWVSHVFVHISRSLTFQKMVCEKLYFLLSKIESEERRNAIPLNVFVSQIVVKHLLGDPLVGHWFSAFIITHIHTHMCV